jgi:hypothetical protein
LQVPEIPSPSSGIESSILTQSERSENQVWFGGVRGFFGRLFGKKEATPSVETTPKPFVAEEIPDPWEEPLTTEGLVHSATSAGEAVVPEGVVRNEKAVFIAPSAKGPEANPTVRPSTTPRPQGFFKGLFQKTGLFLAGLGLGLGTHLLPTKNVAPSIEHAGEKTEHLLAKTFDARMQKAEKVMQNGTFKGAVQVPLKTGGSVVVPLVNHTTDQVKVRLGKITLPDGKVIEVKSNADGKSVTVGGNTYQIK